MTNAICPDCANDRVDALEAEVERLRAERDAVIELLWECRRVRNSVMKDRNAARAEVERLRADLLEAIPSVYAEMGLTDYVRDLHRQLAQLTQALNAARQAARVWKRAAKHWRGIARESVTPFHARWLFRARKEPRR